LITNSFNPKNTIEFLPTFFTQFIKTQLGRMVMKRLEINNSEKTIIIAAIKNNDNVAVKYQIAPLIGIPSVLIHKIDSRG